MCKSTFQPLWLLQLRNLLRCVFSVTYLRTPVLLEAPTNSKERHAGVPYFFRAERLCGPLWETLSRTQTTWLRTGATMLDWQLNVFTFFIRRLWAIRAIKKYGDSFIWKRNIWGLRTSLSFFNIRLDCCVTGQYIYWTAGRHVFKWLDLWRWFSRHNYCVYCFWWSAWLLNVVFVAILKLVRVVQP